MGEFKIESGVPLPKGKGGTNVTEALRQLAKASVGDSIFFPDMKIAGLAERATRANGRGWYTARAEGEGVRVWKIGSKAVA